MNPNPLDYFVGMSHNRFSSVELLPPNVVIAVRGEDDRLFRALPRSRAEEWVERGALRLSPLASYREPQMSAGQDGREGKVRHKAPMSNLFAWRAQHSLCLALTRFPLRHLVRKFTKDKCDPCVMLEIANPADWLLELDRIVRARCGDRDWPIAASVANEIAYSDVPDLDFGPSGAAVNCAFLKPHVAIVDFGPNQYWLEGEVRAIWQTACGSPAAHLCVEAAELAVGCRILDDSELWGESVFPSLRVRRYGAQEHAEWLRMLGNPIGLAAWQRGNAGNAGETRREPGA